MRTPLERGQTYHIYNRGNNRENLFVEKKNYPYFMGLYAKHIVPIADTYAYCLMKNHFHLVVRIKSDEELQDLLGLKNLKGLEKEKILNRSPSRSFSNLFNAYARAFNRMYGRTGSLFETPFERLPIYEERYFTNLIIYTHLNPQVHGFVDDFRDWPYSSYNDYLSSMPTLLVSNRVINHFGGVQSFQEQHQQWIKLDKS